MKFKILSICILLLITNFRVYAEELVYHLVNLNNQTYEAIEDYDSLSKASRAFRNQRDNYDNLVLLENDQVILMEYGIVEFKVNQGCTFNIDYKDSNTNEDRYLNGCYGIDAAYINSSRDASKVYFQIAGSIGYTSKDNVILHPIDNFKMRISSYSVKDNKLYHDIKTQFTSDFYSASILINDAPSYLEEGSRYYSYDGHYFYDDFKLMIDDLKEENHLNAINKDAPYYNYYAYISHRTLSNYSFEEINTYFNNVLGFNKKLDSYFDLNYDNANDDVNRSQYYGELESFIENQYLYGANALMMLSLSINESSYGKSLLAFNRNNLFGHAAFDSDVERNASRYLNIATSVYSHAKYYIGDRYSNPIRSTYYGSFFGDKQSGMNVMYSSDPYWGEKAANYYYKLDQSLGFKDKNAYAIGIIMSDEELKVYDDENLSEVKLTIDNISPYSLILLEKLDNAYKVQLDPSFTDDSRYNFMKSVGYIDSEALDFILNEEKIHTDKYYEVTFDLDGGVINNQDKLSFLVKEGQIPTITHPVKDGYEFVGFDHDLEKTLNNDVYKAEYKKIKAIEIVNYPPNVIEYDYRLDLTGGTLKIVYEDDSEKIIDLDTDMVSGYNLQQEGEQEVIVKYCGLETSYKINVSKELLEYRLDIDEKLDKIISDYKNDQTYNQDEVIDLVNKLYKVRYRLSDDDIRILDKILLDIYKDKVHFYIKDNRFDINISGMALSLDVTSSLNSNYFLYKDTYLLDTTTIKNSNYNLMKQIGQAYGFKMVDSFYIYFKRNAVKIDTNLPFVVQIKVKDMDKNSIYTVYRIDDNGDIEKCRTTRTSDYIEFTTSGDGSFMVLSKGSENIYDIENVGENLNRENDDVDINGFYLNTLRILVSGLICAILVIYYKIEERKLDKIWKDYKKSLRNAECVQEEKPKN